MMCCNLKVMYEFNTCMTTSVLLYRTQFGTLTISVTNSGGSSFKVIQSDIKVDEITNARYVLGGWISFSAIHKEEGSTFVTLELLTAKVLITYVVGVTDRSKMVEI